MAIKTRKVKYKDLPQVVDLEEFESVERIEVIQ